MTFDTDQKSISDSRPVECYDIVFSTVTYRYTSYHRNFVFGGNTYIANGIQRGAITVVNSQDVPEPSVELPITDPAVAFYLGRGIPPQKCTITITRVQQTSGEGKQMATGNATCTVRGRLASFKIRTAQGDPMQLALPNALLTRLCNHVLFDTLCTVDRPSNSVATTISSISTDRRTVVVAAASTSTNDYVWGEFVHTVTKERRWIITQNNTTLLLDTRLRTVEVNVGDAVVISRGCARAVETCRDKYNNVPNFGGAPHILSTGFFFNDLRRK